MKIKPIEEYQQAYKILHDKDFDFYQKTKTIADTIALISYDVNVEVELKSNQHLIFKQKIERLKRKKVRILATYIFKEISNLRIASISRIYGINNPYLWECFLDLETELKSNIELKYNYQSLITISRQIYESTKKKYSTDTK